MAPSKLGRDRQQRRYVLKSLPLVDPADRKSIYSTNSRSESPDRRPRNRDRDANSSRHCRRDYSAESTKGDSHHHYHRHSERNDRYETRGRDRQREDRCHNPDRGTSSLQSMTSWLERLGLVEDEDNDYHSRTKDDTYQCRQRHQTPDRDYYGHNNHNERHRPGCAGSYADRESSIRAQSPSSSPSRSPSRSPSPRRRAVTKHEGFVERERDLSQDRSSYDNYERHDRHDRRDGHHDDHDYHHTGNPQSQRARSVPGRDDSHSRRRPSLKRGPSSSSSASNNSSSSMSKWESAARNALRAGTMAALSSHSAPGSWLGNKGTRVATAALGAALVDTYMGHRHPESVNGVRHTAIRQAAEYAISSIVAEPIMERAARHRARR